MAPALATSAAPVPATSVAPAPATSVAPAPATFAAPAPNHKEFDGGFNAFDPRGTFSGTIISCHYI